MDAEYPFEFWKIFFVLVFFAISLILNGIVLVYIQDVLTKEPLPDLVYSIVPKIEFADSISNGMVILNLVFLIILIVVHKHRSIVTRRTFFIMATLYTMRVFCLMVTQLPPGYENFDAECQPQVPQSERTFSLYWHRLFDRVTQLGFSSGSSKKICGDRFYSGHTMIMIVCAWAIAYYIPRRHYWMSWVPKICALVGIICVLISRMHYTIDVVVAYWLAVGFFNIYHAYAEFEKDDYRKHSPISKFLIVRTVIAWLENRTKPGRIENVYQMPFGDKNKERSRSYGTFYRVQPSKNENIRTININP